MRRNALGRKLSCCLQDRADAVSDPERAAVGGCARPRLGVAPGTAASNRDCGTAISAGCPGIPGGIPDPPRLSGGDNRRDAAAGTQIRRIPTGLVDISMAGRIVHSSGNAVRPYRRLSHLGDATFTLGDLETAVEWYRILADGWFSLTTNRRNCGRFIPALTLYPGRYFLDCFPGPSGGWRQDSSTLPVAVQIGELNVTRRGSRNVPETWNVLLRSFR